MPERDLNAPRPADRRWRLGPFGDPSCFWHQHRTSHDWARTPIYGDPSAVVTRPSDGASCLPNATIDDRATASSSAERHLATLTPYPVTTMSRAGHRHRSAPRSRLLEAVEQDSRVTQRSLATQLGIALGLTNIYLKRLVRKGYIKCVNVQSNRITYLITPRGIAEKARLTYEFMDYSLHLYGEVRQHLRRCSRSAPPPTGASPFTAGARRPSSRICR